MRKWNMTMVYFTAVKFEVEAETYENAVKKAYKQAADFPPNVKDLECELEDYEELPDDYDDPDEEEFEPGRPILNQMALNP